VRKNKKNQEEEHTVFKRILQENGGKERDVSAYLPVP
jgi:hypothetical protein